jgi:hypothetical protein
VGEDVPITGAPGTEEREVRADDPALSPETNARLTEELRETIGADRVRVPADRPHVSRGEESRRQRGALGYLGMHRFVLVRNASIFLTFAAVLALATGSWWILPLAAGVHALGTMAVTLTAIRMTTITEHPAPEVSAALAEEGVSSPDERFSEMVDEFRTQTSGGVGEVVAAGANDRTVEAGVDPARAGAEQSTAWTPSAGPSRAVGPGGTPDLLIWATAGSLLLASILISAVQGGWMWLLAAVMLPLVGGWMAMQRMLHTRAGPPGGRWGQGASWRSPWEGRSPSRSSAPWWPSPSSIDGRRGGVAH